MVRCDRTTGCSNYHWSFPKAQMVWIRRARFPNTSEPNPVATDVTQRHNLFGTGLDDDLRSIALGYPYYVPKAIKEWRVKWIAKSNHMMVGYVQPPNNLVKRRGLLKHVRQVNLPRQRLFQVWSDQTWGHRRVLSPHTASGRHQGECTGEAKGQHACNNHDPSHLNSSPRRGQSWALPAYYTTFLTISQVLFVKFSLCQNYKYRNFTQLNKPPPITNPLTTTISKSMLFQ